MQYFDCFLNYIKHLFNEIEDYKSLMTYTYFLENSCKFLSLKWKKNQIWWPNSY